MLKNELKQLSLYSILYNKIPENHILKKINYVVDFGFINKMLEDSYCKYYGRPAKEPEMMAKLLFLEYLYNHSDEGVIDACTLNLAYMWFIGINPEEELPDASLLTKFRKQRLKETSVDDIIQEVVRQCVEKGIIKGVGFSVDATHSQANTTKLVPERVMKRLAQKIWKSLKEENVKLPEKMDPSIPDYKEIDDPQQAKAIMKDYLEELITTAQTSISSREAPKTLEITDKAKEILSDPKFIEQKGLRSLVDEDARVGYKTKTDSFFGYKVEFAMIPEEGIITAVGVHDGAYVDGTDYKELYQKAQACGLSIKDAYADKAYFRAGILDLLEEEKINVYIPVSEVVYKMDESKFSYNKDSDQWVCEMGNHTAEKRLCKKKKNEKDYLLYRYYFEKEQCRNCPIKDKCQKGSRIAKVLDIGMNTSRFYEYKQREKTEEFQQEYRKRARHEGKNGEMKRFHGMDRARGYGLRSMQIQAKLTALVVNLKRIAKLVSPLNLQNRPIIGILLVPAT
jgi:transposase